MLHPDIKYDMIRSMQAERLQEVLQQSEPEVESEPGFLTSLLNASGDLLIAVGTSLKQWGEPALRSKTA